MFHWIEVWDGFASSLCGKTIRADFQNAFIEIGSIPMARFDSDNGRPNKKEEL